MVVVGVGVEVMGAVDGRREAAVGCREGAAVTVEVVAVEA
jgi:hypothetical protein